jgi:hypothetical protein
MSYKVSVDGEVIGRVVDLPGMTLIGAVLDLAGDKFPDRKLGDSGPKNVSIIGTTIEIETWKSQ